MSLDLVRGGTTLSAVLLAAGFLVAIPWALLTGSHASDDRPPYREAIMAGGALLALNLLTLSPAPAMWDTLMSATAGTHRVRSAGQEGAREAQSRSCRHGPGICRSPP
jgi:hypothetical protein